MLFFKRIAYRNFLSVGNTPIEIDLATPGVVLITGENGCGKSLIEDALYFGLYGRPFRKINKDGLVNSINKKKLFVELEFSIGTNEYKVCRGIKPNIFEVYVNGALKPQPANLRDYQMWLTCQVLRMDERTFKQIIVLGSSSYIPFMRLSAYDRRMVIDDLLRIDIFSTMNNLVKRELSGTQGDIILRESDKRSQETVYQTKTEAAANVRQNVETSLNMVLESLTATIEEITALSTRRDDQLSRLSKEQAEEMQSVLKKGKELVANLSTLRTRKETSIQQLQRSLEFFEQNTVCPTCTQAITHELACAEKEKFTIKIEKGNTALSEFDTKIAEVNEQMVAAADILTKFREDYRQVEALTAEIKAAKKKQTLLEEQKVKLEEQLAQAGSTCEQDLQDIVASIEVVGIEIGKLKQRQEALNAIQLLLRDDGVKLKIIRNHLPIINSIIRKYLTIIGFNLGFTFDESFNEQIKSRGRDVFEYGNFSEGEKLRIDFCLLFTWRELAKLRGSVHTNLLLLDESDGGSLDEDGHAVIKEIIKHGTEGTTVLITHSPNKYQDLADRHIQMVKAANFTKMVEVSKNG